MCSYKKAVGSFAVPLGHLVVLLTFFVVPTFGVACELSADLQCPCDYFVQNFQNSCDDIVKAYTSQGYFVFEGVKYNNQMYLELYQQEPSCGYQRMTCGIVARSRTAAANRTVTAAIQESFGFSAICGELLVYNLSSTQILGVPDLNCSLVLQDGVPNCCRRAGECVLNVTAQLSLTMNGLLQVTLQRSGYLVPSVLPAMSTLTPFSADGLPSCFVHTVVSRQWLVIAVIVVVVVCLVLCLCLGVCLHLRGRQKRHLPRVSPATAGGPGPRPVTLECSVYPATGEATGRPAVVRIQVVPPEQYTGAQDQVVQGIPANFAELPSQPMPATTNVPATSAVTGSVL
eukprot:RCo050338